MDRRMVTVLLPFRVSVKDFVKFKNDQYNINNRIKTSYINKTSIMVPVSKLIELDKILPLFSKKDYIKKILEKPEISFIRFSKWNIIDPLVKYNGFFPVSPDFCVEFRSRNDTLQFRKSKMIEYILQGVQSALLIDPYDNSGCCYYYCATPLHGRDLPLIPDSVPLLDYNLNHVGVNCTEYPWSNIDFMQGYFPQLKIALFGYLNGIILDLGQIKRLD
ncbi:hypothetical protein DICPUDRAFT_152247 [Dictyostelium purpureum]|uniref:Putative restriction endonuclease domain-containing protein n=1 Tax=Dictyostelium purpureum TaxID=5786 RepID=F0ZKV2_DICPU|nr:uncharacterized protein DICPUDRAFT_152247 [Dictyostelium purpureum]EGC35442.1 hypothetical protein DICPUDRAFT_152247 [Dictyostelium purpureum]|eukprot:XP_003288055.1 hypothetical protein DICPUDRAFT_152247 [Dictyostelium purpureum]